MESFTLDKVVGIIVVRPASQTRERFEEIIKEACAALGEVAMGASVVEGRGYWHPTRQYEDNATITANCDADTYARLLDVAEQWAVQWGVRYNQEAVAIIPAIGQLKIISTGGNGQ